MTKYFDRNGNYMAYCPDGKHLFNDDTELIGYFVNGFLYDKKGQAIGHVKGKHILNKAGQTLYYTE